MGRKIISAVAGFIVLFTLYHAAEYMIVFRGSAIGFLLFQLLFFVAAWIIAKWQSKRGLAAWGLGLGKHFPKHLMMGIAMGAVLYGGTFLFSVLLGTERVVQYPTFGAAIPPLLLFVFGNFFSSFSEDILTRGYLYNHLRGRINSGLIIIVSATVYLFNHIYRLDEGVETYLYLFMLGILFIIPLILTKRLWFTGGMHWAGNVTFYFTHEIVVTKELNTQFSANYILIGMTLLLIPLNYLLLARLNLIKKTC
jgi:membrane protease YdiL (CAAX protease family)